MKFALVSDLHLEFYQERKRHTILQKIFDESYDWSDIVVIFAGDIYISDSALRYIDAIAKERSFKDYIYIAGNHDWWHCTKRIHDMQKYNKVYKFGDVNVIACTGWTTESADVMMNFSRSYRYRTQLVEELHNQVQHDGGIDGLSYKQFNYMAELDKSFIFSKIDELKNEKILVATHYPPSWSSSDPKYGMGMIDLFCNNYDHLIQDLPITWVHGHTHSNSDYTIGDCHVVSQPCGYPSEVYGNTKEYRPIILEI